MKPRCCSFTNFSILHEVLAILLFCLAFPGSGIVDAEELFRDDFESGIDRWEVSDPKAIKIIDSKHAEHGRVLLLSPSHSTLYSLIRGSQEWKGYRIEADFLFPTEEHNYLGFIYNFTETGARMDLGSIYIKGNGSYIRVNPRRDWNPGRSLYEEYRVNLTGEDAIQTGKWHHFAAEVVGSVCHFYVGDMAVPRVTFDFFEYDSGKAGFKPRVVGGPVWIDKVHVTAIGELSYKGPRKPAGMNYRPQELVTDWKVLGPFSHTVMELETAIDYASKTVLVDGQKQEWRDYGADPRGAVVTGRVTDFLGSNTVAYYLTSVNVTEGENAEMEFSTIDNLTLWLNGSFDGYMDRGDYAWYDFGRNPKHPRTNGALVLEPGKNQILVRVRGGQYATGGFYARVVRHRKR